MYERNKGDCHIYCCGWWIHNEGILEMEMEGFWTEWTNFHISQVSRGLEKVERGRLPLETSEPILLDDTTHHTKVATYTSFTSTKDPKRIIPMVYPRSGSRRHCTPGYYALMGSHHQAARRITGMTKKCGAGVEWDHPLVVEAMESTGLHPIGVHIKRPQVTISERVACRPVYKLGT